MSDLLKAALADLVSAAVTDAVLAAEVPKPDLGLLSLEPVRVGEREIQIRAKLDHGSRWFLVTLKEQM